MKVLFNDLEKQWKTIEKDIRPRLDNLFKVSNYINGNDVRVFEENFAQYVGVKHCIGTSNGTDAIKLGIRALEILYDLDNTLVIIPNNTYIATALGAIHGLKNNKEIVYVDCDHYHQINMTCLEKILRKKRSAYDSCIVIGVHLFGGCCDVFNINSLCKKYDCYFVEDSAQAHGTKTYLGTTGSIGEFGAFSFYPGKNLGGCGDAGGITTNNDDLNNIIKQLRNMGSDKKHEYNYIGYNNRLDTIQAIILDEKLKHLDEWNNKRNEIAQLYNRKLSQQIQSYQQPPYCVYHTYHLYPILVINRDQINKKITENNIQTGIHYPNTLSNTESLSLLSTNSVIFSQMMISLPMHPFLTKKEIDYVCKTVNEARYISK